MKVYNRKIDNYISLEILALKDEAYCLEHEGMQHPTRPNICCAKECGDEFCGTQACKYAPAGAKACCGLSINTPCSRKGKAPCKKGNKLIGNISQIYHISS